jgi:hypothetical protein
MSRAWGNATWIFLHTISYKIKEEEFVNVRHDMIEIFKQICFVLPCPYCQKHAKDFIGKNDFNKIKNKDDYIIMLWSFHNLVNVRTGKQQFKLVETKKYEKAVLINVLKYFEYNFMRPINNQRLLMDSLGRGRAINRVKTFINNNKDKFTW